MVELTRETVRGFTGEGRYRLSPFSFYEGQWKDGFYDGPGIFVDGRGRRYEGVWVKGKQEGFGTVFDKTYIYIGYFKHNRFDGIGTYYNVFSKGRNKYLLDYFHGNWRQGKKDGEFIHVVNGIPRWELWEGLEMTSLYLDEESEPDELEKACEYFYAGMWVQLPQGTFLFDVANGHIPAMHRDRPVYVMVSGTDENRFNDAIFSLAEAYPNIYFLLPASVRNLGYTVEEIEEAYGLQGRIFMVRGGEDLKLEGVDIQVLGDRHGLAYLVDTGEKRLLHGGTLQLLEESREAAQDLSKALAPYFGTRIDLGMLPMDWSQGKRILGTVQMFRTFFSIKNTALIKTPGSEEMEVFINNYAPSVIMGEIDRKQMIPWGLLNIGFINQPSMNYYDMLIMYFLGEPEYFLLK